MSRYSMQMHHSNWFIQLAPYFCNHMGNIKHTVHYNHAPSPLPQSEYSSWTPTTQRQQSAAHSSPQQHTQAHHQQNPLYLRYTQKIQAEDTSYSRRSGIDTLRQASLVFSIVPVLAGFSTGIGNVEWVTRVACRGCGCGLD